MAKSMGQIPDGHISAPRGYSEGAHGHGGHHRGSHPHPVSHFSHTDNPQIAHPEHSMPKGNMSKMGSSGGAREHIGKGTY